METILNEFMISLNEELFKEIRNHTKLNELTKNDDYINGLLCSQKIINSCFHKINSNGSL